MTTARIDARFAALKAEGRAGFVAYVMAGDPSRDQALDILRGLPADWMHHTDELYTRLDSLRAQTRRRLADVRKAGPSGSPQNRSERDAFATLYEDRIAQLEAVEERLAFGRLDLADGERRYVGRIGLTDEEQTALEAELNPVPLRRGDVLVRQGQEADALAAYQAALAKDPSNANGWYQRAKLEARGEDVFGFPPSWLSPTVVSNLSRARCSASCSSIHSMRSRITAPDISHSRSGCSSAITSLLNRWWRRRASASSPRKSAKIARASWAAPALWLPQVIASG